MAAWFGKEPRPRLKNVFELSSVSLRSTRPFLALKSNPLRIQHRFKTEWKDGSFSASGISFKDLFDLVMSEGVAELNGVFPADVLTDVRQATRAWGHANPVAPPQTYEDRNYHAIESGISPRQKTPHNYHSYNFYRFNQLEDAFRSSLKRVFGPMLQFQNALTGNEAGFEPDAQNRRARPQVIHYPSGGGMFGKHTHPLEPQRVGLILGLSKRGKDFETGGTHFGVGGRDVSSEEDHDIGDLILFRFDIPHWINWVDPVETLDYDSLRGRWTAVLPYY